MAGGADDIPSAISGETSRRLDAIRRALLKEMQRLLGRLDQSNGKLVSTADALDNARRIRSQLLQVIREQGLAVIVQSSEQGIVDAVDAALAKTSPTPGMSREMGKALRVSLDAEVKASIERTVSGILDDVANVFTRAAVQMRKAIDVGVNTGSSLQDVIAEVSQALDTSFVRASTGVDTAVRGAYTKTTVLQAERGAEAVGVEMGYLYGGPEDGKNRPFCERHVDKVYTLRALKQLKNDNGLPVETFLGGYACRHRLSPIDLETARAEGYVIVDG
jgi:hypothetical protein